MSNKTRVPMDMHNCFRECDTGTEHLDKNARAVVDTIAYDLIEALSRKHPSWQFINTSYSGYQRGADYAYRNFSIEDGGDSLGAVNVDRHWRTGEVWYELTNPRLAAKRTRQGPTRTKDLDKALKLIGQHYYGPTLAESVSLARSSANTVVSETASSARWALDKVVREMQPELVSFLTENTDVRERLAIHAPKQAKQLESLPELGRDRAATHSFAESRGSGNNIVLLRGDKLYLVDDVDPTEPHTFDTVPKHIAMGVAMLKLVDIRGFIPDVGVRTDHNVFYIAPPQENQQ